MCRRDVTRNCVDPLPIEDLSAIRALAVREENPKVARVALSRMMQDRGEPIRAFAARLRGQTEVCRFTKKCTGSDRVSNQGEERVADQLCIGLADAEIQEDLLKHPDQDMGVEETIRFVEIRAAGKRSAVTMSTPTSTNGLDEDEGEEAISSTYRRQQRCPRPAKPTLPRPRIRPPNQALPRGNYHPTPRNSSTRGTLSAIKAMLSCIFCKITCMF